MKLLKNRYFILFVAATVNFVYGANYIWTVFQPAAIEKFHLQMSSANRPFNTYTGFFVMGNILGGKLQQIMGSRKTILLGSLIMMFGFFGTSFVPANMPLLLTFFYGGFGGLGCGAAYNALIGTAQRWFPDKLGMVSGITLCTVGAPGLVMTPACNSLISNYGFSKALFYVTMFYTIICFGLGWILRDPNPGEVPETKAKKELTSVRNYRTSEMVKTRQFYLVTGSMAFATMSYFLIYPMMKSLGMERGLSLAAALSGIMIASVMNVAGRLAIPWISDFLGRKNALLTLYVVTVASVLGLSVARGYLFLLGCALICFCYGGFFGLYAVLVSDLFGPKYVGMNYGVIMIGYGFTSVICPNVLSFGVGAAFVIAATGGVIGIICTILLKSK